MLVQFSEFPGSHERHLRRKAANPLFEAKQGELTDEDLLAAQHADHTLLLAFMQAFRQLLHEVSQLEQRTESEQMLALKDRLDRAYETAAAVADDQQATQAALSRLIELVMQAIRTEAGDDAQALSELAQEASARQAHFKLLESALVADLLNPESVIAADELVATLLSADKQDLLAAAQLFDVQQLQQLVAQGEALLARMPASAAAAVAEAEKRLVLLNSFIKLV